MSVWKNLRRAHFDIIRVPLSEFPEHDVFRPVMNLDSNDQPASKADRRWVASLIKGRVGLESHDLAEGWIQGWISRSNDKNLGAAVDASHPSVKERFVSNA